MKRSGEGRKEREEEVRRAEKRSSPPERKRAEWGQRNGENRWIKEGNEEDYS